jgi:DNA helicase HerA-like ATPase
VIEEAHEFAPKERAGIGAENMAIHWAKKLATAGRSKGIRLIVATQRVQALHNAVLGSCET